MNMEREVQVANNARKDVSSYFFLSLVFIAVGWISPQSGLGLVSLVTATIALFSATTCINIRGKHGLPLEDLVPMKYLCVLYLLGALLYGFVLLIRLHTI